MNYPKMRKRNLLLLVTFAAVAGLSFDINNVKIESGLLNAIRDNSNNERHLVWICFTDKGQNTDALLSSPEIYLTQRSIERRNKRVKSENLFDERDLPVDHNYVAGLEESGIIIKQRSKWFNAVSCYANGEQIQEIAGQNFVKKIELVKTYKRPDNITTSNVLRESDLQTDHSGIIDYGPSLNQSNIINVPLAHDLGYSGEGILIASFDSGFDNLPHNCFNRMREKGLRTYDFVNGDTIVADGTGRLGTGGHGTQTLSLIGGYDPGALVAPAFNSQFILAKTENNQIEIPLEEDNWIAAAEWADSLGADIITASLGYLNFDPPNKSYTWESMDGRTARVTIAAGIAISKGIIVVASSGNEGDQNFPNTLNAPADGDSVITVGAVLLTRKKAGFSSYGPTSDGRIKPDVMALGVSNYTARPGLGGVGYIYANGTSMSTPMVAGVCAMILSANPNLSPVQVRNILRSTADSSFAPNSKRGWGIVNAFDAVQTGLNTVAEVPVDYILYQNYPNPFNPSTTFKFSLSKNSNVSMFLYDMTGRQVDVVLDNVFYGAGSREIKFFGDGLSSGIYFYSLIADGQKIASRKMVLIK
ncbi:MAG: S8 family serine peptidase [bacterium]|nr:S8 family serine peptidase [bacterium]